MHICFKTHILALSIVLYGPTLFLTGKITDSQRQRTSIIFRTFQFFRETFQPCKFKPQPSRFSHLIFPLHLGGAIFWFFFSCLYGRKSQAWCSFPLAPMCWAPTRLCRPHNACFFPNSNDLKENLLFFEKNQWQEFIHYAKVFLNTFFCVFFLVVQEYSFSEIFSCYLRQDIPLFWDASCPILWINTQCQYSSPLIF